MGGDDHELLMVALRQRDARTATSLMERHILARGDHLIEILEQRGLWDGQVPMPGGQRRLFTRIARAPSTASARLCAPSFRGHVVVSPVGAREDVVRFTCVASSGRVRHRCPGSSHGEAAHGYFLRTDDQRLADGSDHPTGYLAEEVLEPYEASEAAGVDVVIAPPEGKVPQPDPWGFEPYFHYPKVDEDFMLRLTE